MPFRLPRLLPLLLLTACGESAPPPDSALRTPAAAPVNCLASLSTPSLPAPTAALYAQEFAAAPLDKAGLACVGSVLDGAVFASPQPYDPAYARVQAAHGEDTALRWASLVHQRVQLLRIAQGAAAATWLLRIDTGQALEGSRYDLLFTTDAQGRLRDQLLAGVDGVQYQRDMDLRSPTQFTILENSGREQQSGPGYRAAFRIDEGGRIVHDPAGTTTALDPAVANAPPPGDPADADSATSVEEVDAQLPDIEGVRRLLFSDAAVLEETVQRQRLADGKPVLLALGRTDVAGLVLYVLRPGDSSADRRRVSYQVASLSIAEPDQALGGEVGSLSWQAEPRGAELRVSMRYELPAEGGEPASGEPAAQSVEIIHKAHYDLASGELHRVHD